jgi:hypothetical protein
MNVSRRIVIGACAALMWGLSGAANATVMRVSFSDPQGDKGPVGDVISAQLTFDQTGAWTAHWRADPTSPFTGDARFNLNLFDTALGDLASAWTSQVNLDGFHNFGSATATDFSYSGTTSYLATWHIGDVISTGNGTNFESGVVDQVTPYGRDKLLTSASVTSTIPEPQTSLLLLAAGSAMALMRRLKSLKGRRLT